MSSAEVQRHEEDWKFRSEVVRIESMAGVFEEEFILELLS